MAFSTLASRLCTSVIDNPTCAIRVAICQYSTCRTWKDTEVSDGFEDSMVFNVFSALVRFEVAMFFVLAHSIFSISNCLFNSANLSCISVADVIKPIILFPLFIVSISHAILQGDYPSVNQNRTEPHPPPEDVGTLHHPIPTCDASLPIHHCDASSPPHQRRIRTRRSTPMRRSPMRRPHSVPPTSHPRAWKT